MKWEIKKQYDGVLLRTYLEDVVNLSTRLIKRAKRGKILVNGSLKTVRYVLRQGDIIEIILPVEKSETMVANKIPLHILYEDDDIIVLCKEAGMPTIPSKIHPTNTLANGLLYYYKQQGIDATVHIVTRLDKDTSGLVLIAKHAFSHSQLAMLQRKNAISRTYVAVVSGKLKQVAGSIDAPIGRKETSIMERMVTENGQYAVTHYELMKQFDSYAFVKAQLETGRTHQIRVHFSHIGHPLLGDDLYGGNVDLIKRQALHCDEISFMHPTTKENMQFKVDFPKDIANLYEKSV